MLFPQEIVDAILDHLRGDTASLLNCSLVSHAFLPTSQKHIFAQITLRAPRGKRPPFEPTPGVRLHGHLSASPHLVPLVKELKVVDGDASERTSWIARDQGIASALRMLSPYVKRLVFGSTSIVIDWMTLQAEVRDAIGEALRSPVLVSVEMRYMWNVPASVIAACVELRELKLWSILPIESIPARQAERRIDANLEHVPSRGCLQSLMLYIPYPDLSLVVDRLLDDPRRRLDIVCLRELSVLDDGRAGNDQSLERLLRACSITLERLDFSASLLASDTHSNPIDFTHLPSLRTLRIRIQFYPSSSLSQLIRLQGILGQLSPNTSPNLRTLTLDCYFAALNPIAEFDLAEWRAVDRMLDQSMAFKEVNVLILVAREECEMEMKWLIQETMSEIGGRGILRVETDRGSVAEQLR